MKIKTAILDYMSGIGSFACALHCILLPFVLAILPAMGLAWLGSEYFGGAMILFTIIFGLWAIYEGFKEHRKCWPLLWFGVGILLLLFSEFYLHDHVFRKEVAFGNTIRIVWGKGHPMHHYVSACGGFIIVIAHILNRFFCKGCHSNCCTENVD